VVNPGTASSVVAVAGRGDVTVQNLSVDSPIVAASGGGLNSTLTVPLPLGGLPPGSSVDVAFTFQVDTGGTFWFGYDVDAK
jgi:FtsP/CotA-like multicopper oxidase with cupredoxin domain